MHAWHICTSVAVWDSMCACVYYSGSVVFDPGFDLDQIARPGGNPSGLPVIIITIIHHTQSLVGIRIRLSLGESCQQRSIKCTYHPKNNRKSFGCDEDEKVKMTHVR